MKMKKKMQRYPFAVLSIAVIGLFFTFTGGVHDGNNIQLAPPTITFSNWVSTIATGEYTSFDISISDNDPRYYSVNETCDLPPYPPQTDTEYINDPSPEYRVELYKSGINLGELPDNTFINFGDENYIALYTDYFAYSQPGTYQIVVTARTKTFTTEEYVNGELRGGGEPVYSEWTTVSSPVITVTGTAVISNNRYYFNQLTYVPAPGDPNPVKTYTFTDTSRQYLDIVSAVKANMKFYWTPPAADTVLYPNLASKYEFNIMDATYSVADEDGNPATTGYNLTLNYNGQSVKFAYINSPSKVLQFKRPSKTIAGQNDLITISFE